MCQVNQNLFLEKRVDKHLLENITQYCSNCYRSLGIDDTIYLDAQNYNYICCECAHEKTQDLALQEPQAQEDLQEVSLF